MNPECKDFEVLISGYLDGELRADDRQRIEAHLAACPACRREYAVMKSLAAGTAAAFTGEDLPMEAWDRFLDGVYNRLERKSGWIILILGMIALCAYGIVLFFTEDEISLLAKTLITVPVVGAVVLFISVLRQRIRAAKTDRYSREVQR